MLIIGGFLTGALFFTGLGLGLNSLFFEDINPFFLVMLALTGGMVGGILGLLLRGTEQLAHAWLVPLGSLLLACIVLGFSMAFDYFIFGPDGMHWRGLITLSLLSTTPGLLVGWMLAQQLSDELETRVLTQPDQRTRVEQTTAPYTRSGPNPLISSEYRLNGSTQLMLQLQQETANFPAYCRNTQITPVQGMAGVICVTTQLNTRQGPVQVYLTCETDYPHIPPRLQLENIYAGIELRLRPLPILEQWRPNYGINEVIREVARIYQ
ncbi:MAG: hypothetical protein KDJ52_09835 [Anaerolineae bacterium]|nr:hypothetical protein [Anaerolineae bacterium]